MVTKKSPSATQAAARGQFPRNHPGTSSQSEPGRLLRIARGCERQLARPGAQFLYSILAATYPDLSGFANPVALLHWLLDAGAASPAARDRKDEVLRALIVSARTKGCNAGGCAWLLLLGAMGPTLAKKMGGGRLTMDEMQDAFTSLVQEVELSTVRRVAATLARSTRRDALAARRRAENDPSRRVSLPEEDGGPGADGRFERFPEALTVYDPDPFEPDGPDPDDTAQLRDDIAAVVGAADAELVVGAAVHGVNQKVMAERLGIKHAAARKRYERAIRRLEHGFARARRRQHGHTPATTSRSRMKPTEGGSP